MARRALTTRFLSPAAFGAALVCFFLPFLTASQERVAEATGVQLMTGDASFSGRYVHASYEGEVERVVRQGRVPAILAFAAGVIGLLVSWIRRRDLAAVAFVSALVGVFSLLALFQTTTARFTPVDRHHGHLLALAFVLVATASSVVRFWTERPVYRPRPGEPVPPWLQ